ncbi:MAG: DEAD/DEAH box helicase [Kiritimatiellae bacterium]|nr:DEAD/DEAH box helicase [Kiritimatiellia bacterium]
MGLLSKIKSILGIAPKSDSKPRQAQSHAAGKKNRRDHGRKGANGQYRSRTARPSRNGEGTGEARAQEQRHQKPRREQQRPQASKTRSDAAGQRDANQQRQDFKGQRDHHRRGRNNKHQNRTAEREQPRTERKPRILENTPDGMERPGGAFTKEQLKAYAAAHAAWDPSSYVVPEAEGKKRFTDFDLPSEILHAVSDLEFQYCTPIQAQSLEYSLAGKNVAGRAQTGTGKTAAFLIAVLTRYLRTPEKRNLKPGTPRALILAPTRELVIQICKDAEALGRYCGDVRSLAVYGGMDYNRQRRELEDEPVDLLVATPGRLIDFVRNHIVDLRQVDTLVIDEADRMLDMGFIPDVRTIVNRLPDRDHRCTMLYSATLNETVMNLAAMWMRDPVRVEIESDSLATDTVRQLVYIACSEEKFTLLYNHLAKHPGARTIIFCNRKFTTERVCEGLRRRGIPCEMLSGDVNQVKRLKILEAFRAGNVRTVVATDVAGRGIHVDDIQFVVNYDFPYEPEDYVHRIGRTGRAGNTGTAISFADENESFTIPDIEAYINEPLKCIMPEEWMFAELPPLQPRTKRHQKREAAEAAPAVEATEPSAEVAPEGEPAEVPAVTPVTEATVAPEVEAPATETVVEATPVETPAEAPVVEAAVETPAPEAAPKAEEAPAVVETKKAEEPKRQPSERKNKPAKAQKSVRPEREPRFKPRSEKQHHKNRDGARAPRSSKPVAQRFARTQADGPRDGSESHHAAPITARPIYTPGHRGPITDEWTPGQS